LGKTKAKRQRFRCLLCKKTYVWKKPYNKFFKEKHWFDLWVKESYNIRQLCKISGHSKYKLEQIKNYWLDKYPKELTDYSQYKYIIYDGTYFHKNGCLICLMGAKTKDILSNIYTDKEGIKSVMPWFKQLKKQGLTPYYIVMDGERSVIRAIKKIWPKTRIQRCLYHIQREGMRWLRTYPKTEAGKELRKILATLCSIRSLKEKDKFIAKYENWLEKHNEYIKILPVNNIAFKDLKRTVVLIDNALNDMFYFLKEPNITSTTNALEGYYSRLKADYRRHRGLSQKHKISYLKWYCFLKNNNTF
jgi:transposase-like protein